MLSLARFRLSLLEPSTAWSFCSDFSEFAIFSWVVFLFLVSFGQLNLYLIKGGRSKLKGQVVGLENAFGRPYRTAWSFCSGFSESEIFAWVMILFLVSFR